MMCFSRIEAFKTSFVELLEFSRCASVSKMLAAVYSQVN